MLKKLLLLITLLTAVPATASYVPSAVKSVQRGTITITSDTSGAGTTSNTATITSVNTTYSAVDCLGWSNNNGTDQAGIVIGAVLTNATTVTATMFNDANGSISILSFEVMEFVPNFIKSIQATSVTIAGGSGSNTATISSVNTAKTRLFYGCPYATTNPATNLARDVIGRVTLTNATTLTANRGNNNGAIVIPVTVVEFR